MSRVLRLAAGIAAMALVFVAAPRASAPHQPTIAQFLKPGLPTELVSARKADRIAWIAYEEGKRNIFTAAAPNFLPVRVTAFLQDDGIDLTSLRISDDGATLAFVRGSAPNNVGWVANPSSDPAGAERAIWGARAGAPGAAWRLAEGNNPELSPDGHYVLYVKNGQIYRAHVGPGPATTLIDRGDKPFITAWGTNSAPRWSPDGSKIAFTSDRTNHSFIGVYNMKTRTVSFIAPGVDRDTNPLWSPDGRHLVFVRRPGTPFGLQSPGGSGTTGAPGAPAATGRRGGAVAPGTAVPAPAAAAVPPGAAAVQNATASRSGGAGQGRGGRGGEAQIPPNAPNAQVPGLYRAAFVGGYTLSLWIADITTGEAHEFWHPGLDEKVLTNIPSNLQWAGDSLIFQFQPQSDEWERYYSLNLSGGSATSVQLTTTDGLIENATSVSLSKDGKTLYYCTNAGDIDRRHIWAVSTSGGTPKQVTSGDGIENVPVTLASGKQIAVLSADATRPLSVALWPVSGGGTHKVIYPKLGADFPMADEVVPTNVALKAEDGVEFHNQLFLPKDSKPGEKRPALIFVHGGPQRQMLLGWHYLNFYHVFYGVNQWLTTQGYIVLSVNYRSGIGYGRSFRQAPNTGGRGNSEYRDVLAAGKWLAARPDVDPNRVGIWGLSYGGLLTAEALARNSDIFKAGVDLAGVHLEGNSLDSNDVSYTSSAISEIDHWKSPVLLVHGDDDRNVNFAQTVGLVQLLRARNVYYELIVYPDDVHETLLHSRWLYTFSRMDAFLRKFFGGGE
jgi:dipeptidyl-peptidase-4